MLELKIKKTRIKLNFSFFAVLTLLLMLDDTRLGIASLAACGIHEFSHLLVMALFKIPADEITFYSAGVRISSPQTDKARCIPRFAILFAGCGANFIAAILYWMCGNIAAAAVNLSTGMFNLLPIGEHDGAEILKMLLIKLCCPEKVDKTLRAAGIISALCAVGAVLFLGSGTPPILILAVLYFLVIGLK